MDRVLSKIVVLLEDQDPQLRRAAATVIAALKPDDPKVVAALIKSLDVDDFSVRGRVLDALAALPSLEAFEAVAPFLADRGDLGKKAMEAVAAMGPKVLTRLGRKFDGASSTAQRRMLAIAARLRGAAGTGLIVHALEQGHAGMVLQAGQRLSEELARARPRERKVLIERVERFLTSDTAARDSGAAEAGIDVLARVLAAEKNAAERLVAYAAPSYPPYVRRRAIEGLGRVAAHRKLPDSVITNLVHFLNDKDFTNVVAPAMAVLEATEPGPSHAGALLRCLRGNDPALRRFAVTTLGRVDTPGSARALLQILQGDNPDLQKRAAVSLSQLSHAVPLVVSGLNEAPDSRTAWILARILHPHAHRLRPEQANALAKAAAAWLEPGDPRAEAVVSVLRDRHPAALLAASKTRISRLKRDGKAAEIVNILRPQARDMASVPSAIAFELALAAIVMGKKDVVREVRLGHPGLMALEELAREAEFDLPGRLKKERKWLSPEDYYLIGCHFAERSFVERSLGGELLTWLVKTFPGDGCAVAAAHKLVMEGFPPPPAPRKPPRPKKKVKKVPAPAKPAPAKPALAKTVLAKTVPAKAAPAKAAPAKRKPAPAKAEKKPAPAGKRAPPAAKKPAPARKKPAAVRKKPAAAKKKVPPRVAPPRSAPPKKPLAGKTPARKRPAAKLPAATKTKPAAARPVARKSTTPRKKSR